MFFIFLNKYKEKLFSVFFFLFGKDNLRLQRVQNVSINLWKSMAKLRATENEVLYFFSYENKFVKDALYYIKNKKDEVNLLALCNVATDLLLEELGDLQTFDSGLDFIIISIPTSKEHVTKRGFNPSKIIAQKISELLQIPYKDSVLEKTKNTPPQKTLSRTKRLENVKHSMRLNRKYNNALHGKSVIVIDDIVTTGATLAEAKRELLKNGVRKVICVAMAH